MNIQSSSPFPLLTFAEGDGSSPSTLLKFLRGLIDQHFVNSTDRKTASIQWASLIHGIFDTLGASFPMPSELPWQTLHEKIALTEVILDAVMHCVSRVDMLFTGSASLTRKTFTRLLNLCAVLDVWIQTLPPEENGVIRPHELQQKCIDAIVLLLRNLGGPVAVVDKELEPPWRVLQDILGECLTVCQELISSSPTTTFPMEVRLFRQTALEEHKNTEAPPLLLGIEKAPDVPLVLGLILSLVSKTLSPSLFCDWFMKSVMREALQMHNTAFYFCVSPTCFSNELKRSHGQARILASALRLSCALPAYMTSTSNMAYAFLLRRFKQGPMPTMEETDSMLCSVMEQYSIVSTTPEASVNVILASLQEEQWVEDSEHVKVMGALYIRGCISRLSSNTLQEARQFFMRSTQKPAINDTVTAIQVRLQTLTTGGAVAPEPNNGSFLWRPRATALLETLIAPDAVSWMDEDDALDDAGFASHALGDIKQRFSRPLRLTNAQHRLELARGLAELVCMLAHPTQPKCDLSKQDKFDQESLPFLDSLAVVLSRLLDGTNEEATPIVKSNVYDLLAKACGHDASSRGEAQVENLLQIIQSGMHDQQRSIRMAAGRALTSLYKSSGGTLSSQRMIHLINYVADAPQDGVKETTILTAGLVAKVAQSPLLGDLLLFLIARLSLSNVVLKGAAYMQIVQLANARKQSPYSLVSPYMSTIAPFVVSQFCAQPTFVRETCQLFSMGQAGFISLTLTHTLPQLFAQCERKVLARISQELDKRPYTLFVDHSHEIFAYIYLLPTEQQIDQGLKFILQTLVADAGDPAKLQLDSLLRSCIVNLLTELVSALGEESVQRREAATRALEKIAATLREKPEKNESPVTALLAKYMRGLITHLTETLQGFRSKRTNTSKRPILRALEVLMSHIGWRIANVAPQVMACMQALLPITELAEPTLATWHALLTALRHPDIGPHVAVTTASLVVHWPSLSPSSQQRAQAILEYMLIQCGSDLADHIDEAADLSSIPTLRKANKRISGSRSAWSTGRKLQSIIDRTHNDNNSVALRALVELKTFMATQYPDYMKSITSGDVFDPIVGHIVSALIAASARDGEGTESVRLLAFECMGILGALDPDRFEVAGGEGTIVILNNFRNEEESLMFALHLIRDVLVGTFRSTSDVQYQGHLAFAIQELLRFCNFTPAMVDSQSSVPVKVRNRWNSLPDHVLETVTPLLDAGYTLRNPPKSELSYPIYPAYPTYREWMQVWVGNLITRVSSGTASNIFSVFQGVIRQKDAAVAHHLFPHLVLHVLISGNEDDLHTISGELLCVLQDQVDPNSRSTPEKKILSAQAIFSLVDHLNKWVRSMRQDVLSKRRPEARRSRVSESAPDETEEQLLRVDSILSNINRDLMARAALQCKSYALSLMNFERQVVALGQAENAKTSSQSQEYFERLHEIYAHLDEPDGMEGVSTMIMSPSLEHQIRQHESTGHWTSAQSCWEVRLQQSPDNLEFHIGLLRCLRNLGHYDTLRTHVKGVLTRNPEWEPELAGFQVESSWMVGDWDDVRSIVVNTKAQTPQVTMARLLLSMGNDENPIISQSLTEARVALGAPIVAAGVKGYRQAYDAFLDLHHVCELELIYECVGRTTSSQGNALAKLSSILDSRLESTLPAFRTRERIMSVRRTGFQLSPTRRLDGEVSRSWVTSAKLARKAGHWQTAYSAMLQARQSRDIHALMESAKLVKAMGEPLRALHELENSLRLCGVIGDEVIDLTMDSNDGRRTRAKAQMLRARWMRESERFDGNHLRKVFTAAAETFEEWESGHFYLGQFQDEYYKELSDNEKKSRGVKIIHQVVKAYHKSLLLGSKFVYQTVPRMLTLWLDTGEDPATLGDPSFTHIQKEMFGAIRKAKVYTWYTAFPQIVSRVGHQNEKVYELLSKLISLVIMEYPRQALWLFASVVKSKTSTRQKRGKEILNKLREKNINGVVTTLINECISMVDNLLALCDHPVRDDRRTLSMKKDFPQLNNMMPSRLIIPLQESLTANMPTTSSTTAEHQPFPHNAPLFQQFFDEVEIMKSLAKPRKVTVKGNDGQIYMFLGKPKDDLRKDARLMDLNAIINKILKANSDSRRRHLHIRTYGVVTLNEECGFIQWVPNTIPIRPVLLKSYDTHGIKHWTALMSETFAKIKEASDRDAAMLFQTKILPAFPPVFHEWFLETFPEPSAWLASRLAYARSAAVMSIVGFVLGLGDRHCENILLDANSGGVVHVDFNCLFEKGKTLETPERVPFRLTQNMVDGLGVTGYEGLFRIACELTFQLLRDNKDTLMSILDAFIHDPLVEWEDEKRKRERANRRNQVKENTDLRSLARDALEPIKKKLSGIYTVSPTRAEQERELSTNNLVQMLIQEATDPAKLGKMYPGWSPWL